MLNTPISHIPTEFVTESLCDGKNKENNLILKLNTDSLQLSDNWTIPSIPAYSNTLQLVNIVDKLSTNQTTGKIEAQLTAMNSYVKCEISNIDQKLNLFISAWKAWKKLKIQIMEYFQKCYSFGKWTNKKGWNN